MTISGKPRAARAHAKKSHEAWWYENDASIDVYIYDPTNKVQLSARIPRRTLADWIKRTEQKP